MHLKQLLALTIGMLLVSAMFAQSRPVVEQQMAAGKYVVTVKIATSQSVPKPGPSKMEAEYCYELLVHKPDAMGQKVQVAFNRLSASAKGGGMEELFQHDTDKPAGEDRYSMQFRTKAMVGMPMVTTIGTSGKIGEISGIDDIVKKADAANDPMGKRTVESLCRTSATEAVVPLLFHFPEEPIVKGHAWTRNDQKEIGPMGALKMTQTYTVKRVEDTPDGRVAEISFSAKNTSDKPVATDEDSAKVAMMIPDVEVTNQVEGTIKVNLATRMLVSSKMHTKATMKGTSLMDGKKTPLDFTTEGDSEVVVTPAKNTPTSSTGQVGPRG